MADDIAVATAAAAAAAAIGAAAYLDARLYLSKDVRLLWRLKAAEKRVIDAFKAGRASLFYPFEDSCKEFPDIRAIWSREGSYTRKQTYDLVCQYANFFLSHGVQPGEIVAVYHMNSPEFMFIWMGLLAIGAAPGMINYNLSADPLVHCTKIAGAKILIVDQDDGCQSRIKASKERLNQEAGVEVIILDDELKSKILQADASRPPDSLRKVVDHPHKPMALIYTSGTTGLPKAFGFEVGRMLGTYMNGREIWQLTPGEDTFYVCMPMYHGTGGTVAIGRLLDGTGLAIGKKFSTSGFWDDIRDSGSTAFTYVGEAARYLLAAPPSPMDKQHNVRLMYGNGLRPDVWKRFQERFGVPEVCEFFSSTEGMLALAIYSKSGIGSGTVGHQGAILRALTYNRYVPVVIDSSTGDMWRDPHTGFAKRSQYLKGGEIIIRMDSKAEWPGYHNSQAATEKKIVRDVFKKGDMFYRPGDALKRDADGYWYFVDRLGDTFRWKGENVSTAEVAEILGRHPDVHEANVYGVSLPNHDGRAGCAAIELTSASKSRPDWKSLARFARANLPKYAVPIFIRVAGGSTGDMGTHNHKQDKMPYRIEGVDPSLRGTKVSRGSSDEVYWLPTKGDAYVPFTNDKWDELASRRLKL